jgi:hypothetical protein
VAKRKPARKSRTKRFQLFPPIPKGFDAEKATPKELRRYGIPLRPDPSRDPGLSAIWDRSVRHYRDYEHLQASITPGDLVLEPIAPALGLFPREACGFELTSFNAPFTIFSGRWVVPNLHHSPTQAGTIFFRTFFGLGFLDVHVEMTVDPGQNVTSQITLGSGPQVDLPVRPGDWMNVMLCLQTNPAGTAAFFLTNETTRQRTNFSIDTGFPPAVTINAGISRGVTQNPFNPLADFGTVYFDELSAFTTSGTRLLVDGTATSMVDNGVTLARPIRLNDFAFRIDHA